MYIELILNLGLLVAISVVSGFVSKRWSRENRTAAIIQGALFGAAAVFGMMKPLVLGPGLIFDGRSVMLSLCALFFGPWAAAPSVLMAMACRLWLGGGGALMGVLVILSSAGLGLFCHFRWRPQLEPPSTWMLYMFGIAVHLVMVGLIFTLPYDTALSVLKNIGLPVMLLYPLATILVGKILSDQESSFRFMEELQVSEKKYKELVENANSIILRWDTFGKITFMNEYALNFFGYSHNEIIGQKLLGTIVPQSDSAGKDLSQMVLDIAIHPERYKNNENENMLKNGTRVWVVWTNKPIMDDHGQCIGILCVGNDITERKKAETATKQEHSFNSAIIDSIPGTFYMLDENGRYVRWNAYQRDEIVGKSEESITGTAAIDTIHPDDRELIQKRIGNVLANGAIETVEGRVLLHGGPAFRWLLMTGRRMMIDGHPFLVGIGIDITASKEADEVLREREDRFRGIFENSPGSFYIHDPVTGRILDANRNALLSFGLKSIQEFYSGIDLFLSPPYSYDEYIAMIHKAADEGVQRFEWKNRDIKGNIFWEEVFLVPIYLNGEKKILQSSYNITERKQAEAEREKLENQLFQSQKMEAVGQLAGGVAHDFNNMLSVINGYSDMMLMEMSTADPNYERIKEIHKAGLRSSELTQQLLAFARKQTIAPKVIDWNDAVVGMLKMLQRLIGENIELVLKPAATPLQVKMDPSQVNQILANLIVNARDAISVAGKIEIETGKEELDEIFCDTHPDCVPGKYVILSVSDNGCGMGRETLEHIFEPFFTTKKVGEGTGLGLATVFGIVKQNNGFIDVCSEIGKGTAFKIYLPRHEPVDGAKEKGTEKARMFSGIETVLLVEDEVALLQFAKRLLEQLGYTVLPASSPGEGIMIAGEYKGDIHLLMTDVVMPEMSGRDLWDRISSMRSNIKCLYMSGYTADVIAHKGVLDEGIHFLEKPFTVEALSVKLREALS